MKADIESLEAQESRVAFLDEQERRAVGTVIAGNGGDTVAALESRVSIMRVLQAGVEGRSLTGAELEYAQETERRTGRKATGVRSEERRGGKEGGRTGRMRGSAL